MEPTCVCCHPGALVVGLPDEPYSVRPFAVIGGNKVLTGSPDRASPRRRRCSTSVLSTASRRNGRDPRRERRPPPSTRWHTTPWWPVACAIRYVIDTSTIRLTERQVERTSCLQAFSGLPWPPQVRRRLRRAAVQTTSSVVRLVPRADRSPRPLCPPSASRCLGHAVGLRPVRLTAARGLACHRGLRGSAARPARVCCAFGQTTLASRGCPAPRRGAPRTVVSSGSGMPRSRALVIRVHRCRSSQSIG